MSLWFSACGPMCEMQADASCEINKSIFLRRNSVPVSQSTALHTRDKKGCTIIQCMAPRCNLCYSTVCCCYINTSLVVYGSFSSILLSFNRSRRDTETIKEKVQKSSSQQGLVKQGAGGLLKDFPFPQLCDESQSWIPIARNTHRIATALIRAKSLDRKTRGYRVHAQMRAM